MRKAMIVGATKEMLVDNTMNVMAKKIRVPDLALMKERHEPIVMLTAYDATMARLLDQSGVDILLVGNSLGNVILGLDTALPDLLYQLDC